MFTPFISIGGTLIPTYSLLLGVGIVALWVALIAHAAPAHRGAWGNIGLATLGGALLGARALHVALHWDYFGAHPDEISILAAGGLDGRGAFLGGLLASALVARAYRWDLPAVWDKLAWALPLIGLLAWWGCAANRCAYGTPLARSSDFPAWLVWEADDLFGIPALRFAVQPLAMAYSACCLALLALVHGRGWWRGYRLWAVLAVYAAGMAALGVLRADPVLWLWGWRADVLGDALLAIWGAALVGVTRGRWMRMDLAR